MNANPQNIAPIHLPAPGFMPNLFNEAIPEEAKPVVVFQWKKNFTKAINKFIKTGFSKDDFTVERASDGNLLDTTLIYSSKIAEGAVMGAIFGLVFGALIGIFGKVGLDVLSASPGSSAIATTIASGFIFTIIGALIGMSIREYHIENYSTWLQDGNILVNITISDPARAKEAVAFLVTHGGTKVASPNKTRKMA